jgi:pimeloyl-ACP methyl ester carboxylesterase
MFDQGQGPPIVVVPGVQGRWEWLAPALAALARRHRVISYTLAGDFGAGARYRPAAGFDNYLVQLDGVLDRARIDQATLCGVSYGGLIALRYAATRRHRVSSLVIVSSPAPGWKPTAQQQRFVSRPWVSAPAFVLTAPRRLYPEVRAAYPGWRSRMGFALVHGFRVLRAPAIPSAMAARVTLQQSMDFRNDCARVAAPTLVITGEEPLDRVVPVGITRRYASLIPGARLATIERTGHLGTVTRPERFAELVGAHVAGAVDRWDRDASNY